ncbi:hypothetical protein FBZ94_12027 [Bradyrhizobium sacchari]|uniref:Transposase n=1 Tax=Bradyrhizobium sacchari TaxID=1399419 RepID=A0A560HL74_9BRAD|nr:hypothetical protein FBZ94_12027 [Bradyrhizobium sacchari]TWB66011.1 hypothetical protein FBZ95_1197 [Bradyrhizobium sacchari]
MSWAVGIPRHQKVYPVDVKLIWPITKVRGTPRKHHVPDILSIAAEQILASAKWKTVSWQRLLTNPSCLDSGSQRAQIRHRRNIREIVFLLPRGAHQQLNEELGLDHFEGRSWQGLHSHALMTRIAYAFLQHRRLLYAERESTGLRLKQPCPPYVTPSSISSFGRRLSSADIAESKSLKNSRQNTFCQSSVRARR